MVNQELIELPASGGSIYYRHESSYVDEGAVVGEGTIVWHTKIKG